MRSFIEGPLDIRLKVSSIEGIDVGTFLGSHSSNDVMIEPSILHIQGVKVVISNFKWRIKGK